MEEWSNSTRPKRRSAVSHTISDVRPSVCEVICGNYVIIKPVKAAGTCGE